MMYIKIQNVIYNGFLKRGVQQIDVVTINYSGYI